MDALSQTPTEPPTQPPSRQDRQEDAWRILIVDDEEDVHHTTVLALGREQVCGRNLQFLHAYSAREALEVLHAHQDIAVVLLDVVMESDAAGLNLVKQIREQLGREAIRIILRTGQPGYAPELDSVKRYDINDYRSKTELTRTHLYTSLTTAIRSYAQIVRLEQSKDSLKCLTESAKRLLQVRSYTALGKCLADYLSDLLHTSNEGWMVCVNGIGKDTQNADVHVIHPVNGQAGEPLALDTLEDKTLHERIREGLEAGHHDFHDDYSCLCFAAGKQQSLLIYVPQPLGIEAAERQLLSLFSNNVLAALENVRLLEQRRLLAFQDMLLGIPSRMAFMRVIDKCLQQKIARQIVVLLDLDQFGAINDTIGPQNGDLLLGEIAQRLTRVFNQYMVARVSGDTFGLLGDVEHLTPEAVRGCFNEPFYVGEVPHIMSVTQGRVEVHEQRHASEVLSQANVALKRAKHTLRGGFENFHSAMLKETENRVHLMQNLRQAFDSDRLFMVFQPKINLDDGSLTGIEALMRWRTEQGNMIPPNEFIPVAESSGLIIPLGEWALKSSLVAIGEFRRALGLSIRVAVNVSVVQLKHPDFVSVLERALSFAGASHDWLELEITESFAMDDLQRGKQLISDLNKLGVKISIDDFGTGFSSLKYLEQLEISTLKIDKSFVDRIVEANPDTRIPETILRLGQVLNMEVIAEGIETEFQAHWLKKAGCHQGQGYFFARPMPLDQVIEWVTQQHSSNSAERESSAGNHGVS